MKYKKSLSLFLAGSMIISSMSFNALADSAILRDVIDAGSDDVASGSAVDDVETVDTIDDQPLSDEGNISLSSDVTKVPLTSFDVGYGKGKVEFVSGYYNDDKANYPNGYLIEGQEVVITAEPEDGWQVNPKAALAYFDLNFGTSFAELTPVDGEKNQYKFTVPSDYYTGMFYAGFNFAPILADGEYEIKKNDDGATDYHFDIDKWGAKPGDEVTITMWTEKNSKVYVVPTITDEAGNVVEYKRKSIDVSKRTEGSKAVYTFVMPNSTVTVAKESSSSVNYTVKTTPAEFAQYVTLPKTASIAATTKINVVNEIDGKYYKPEITLRATEGSSDVSTDVSIDSVANGVTTYKWVDFYAVDADVELVFKEATPYTITDNTNITNGKFTLSNSSKAVAGDTVTMKLTATTANGYYYDTTILPIVTDANGNKVEVKQTGTNTQSIGNFSFVMPESNVTVTLPDDIIKQRDLRTIAVADDSKDYISTDLTEGRQGNSVKLTLNDPNKEVKIIKVEYANGTANYFTSTAKKFTMLDSNAVISVITSANSWLSEGNYDAELYNSNATTWNISDAKDFAALGKKLSEDSTFFSGKTINITKDIDMSGYKWFPVEFKNDTPVTINGNGKTISGLDVEGYASYCGLFSKAYGLKINDLNFEGKINAHLGTSGTSFVGSLLGYVDYSSAVSKFNNCSTKFDIAIDGLKSYGSLYVADFGYNNLSNSVSLINSNIDNNFVINNCGVPLQYNGLIGRVSNGAVANNISSTSVQVLEQSNDSVALSGIAETITGDVFSNNVFCGTLVAPSTAKINGITSNFKDATTPNYSYFTPVVTEGSENEDYLVEVDANNKVGRVKLVTLLNDWVSDNNTSGEYYEWASDTSTGKPVHKVSENDSKSYNITSEVTGSEYGELTVDSTASAGKKVTVYATPKSLCVLNDIKVVLASDNSTVSIKKNDDGSYSFYMPGEDVKVLATFAEDSNNIVSEQTGKGTVKVTPSVTGASDKATSGETITVKATPDKESYYLFDSITVNDKEGNAIDVTKVDDETFTFVMPKSDVTISTVFKDVSDKFNADGTLKDGTYKLPVSMRNASDHSNPSMAASCVVGGTIVVKDGQSKVTIDLQPVSTMGLTASAKNWKIYRTNNGVTEKVDTEYHTNESGDVDQITFEITADDYKNGGAKLNLDVDVLGGMNVDGWFAMDFVSTEAVSSKTPEFGSAKTKLSAGTYNIPISMMKGADITQNSMAGSCVKSATLTVNEDGTAKIKVNLGPVQLGAITGWAKDWKIYQTNKIEGTPVSADETKNAEGNVEAIEYTIPDITADGTYVNMFIDAMGTSQDAYFKLDYANAKADTETSYEFGSAKTKLSAGTYNIPISMMKGADITQNSMAGSCVKSATLTVNEDGTAKIKVNLGPVQLGAITGWAKDWKIYQTNKIEGTPVSADETKNAEGNVEAIEYTIPDITADGTYVNMFIDAMGTSQDAYFKLDYANAKSDSSSDEKVYEGTAHIDQFGEYDVNVKVTVKDGVITGIEIAGDNFGGSYADYNKSMLQKAIDGLKEVFNGKSSTDANGINDIDGVTGATISSDAIKEATLNALNLVIDDEIINVPTEKLAEGEYTVDIAYYSDAAKHSLVENDKIKAKIKVDANGKVTLTTDIINGTSKEPLYVEGFNGYYADNDKSKELKTDADVTMGTVDYSDDVFTKGTPVVTKVSFPLEGEYAKIYNTNAKLYVPAMKNLTGELNGVTFTKGVFDVDCFAKIYWDSIAKVEGPTESTSESTTETTTETTTEGTTESTTEATTVADGNYTGNISILRSDNDNVSSAGSYFNCTAVPIEVANGKAKVKLAYTTNMITKIGQFNGKDYDTLEPVVTDDGKYVIATLDSINDVKNLQLTVSTPIGEMVHTVRLVVNKDTLEKVKANDTVTYSVPVKMVQAANPKLDSMGNGALDGNAIVTVKDGKATIDLNFKAVNFAGLYGHLLNMWSYPTTDTMNYDWWGKEEYEIPAQVVAKYTDYGMNYNTGDKTQSEFIKTVRLSRNVEKENSIFVRISADAMAGTDQVARLDLDWDKATVVENPTTETTTENTTESTTEVTSETTTESTTEATTEKATETTTNSGNNGGENDNVEDGKYWVNVDLWNANIDQESMGNSAFNNNRKALVTIENGKIKVEMASNPVEVSGYTSALKNITSDAVSINVDKTDSFTTNTRYDGKAHTFNYISKFSFELDNNTVEYIPVKISVPYTPMDNITDGGYVDARIKIDWSSMSKTDSNATLNPDSSSSTGSTGGGGGSSVNASSDTTGIKVEAEANAFEDGTKFESEALTKGTVYDTAKKLIGNDSFRLFSVKATNDGNEVNPNGVATVYIPVVDTDGDNVVLYRITEGSAGVEAGKTQLEYKLSSDGKYYVITVKELGLFAVSLNESVVENTENKTTETTENKTNIAETGKFNDISGHWAEEYINKVAKAGLLMGVSDDKFAPETAVTRGMFVTVLGRLAGVTKTNGTNHFSDVVEDAYYTPFVIWANGEGIVSGISNDLFAPNANITREQMAVILNKFAASQGIELKKINRANFTDSDAISDWAKDSVDALSQAGIINGRTNGSFDPKGTATRAEIASMLVNFLNEYMPDKLA